MNMTLHLIIQNVATTMTSQLIYYNVTDESVSHVRIENDASEFKKEEEKASSQLKINFHSASFVCCVILTRWVLVVSLLRHNIKKIVYSFVMVIKTIFILINF